MSAAHTTLTGRWLGRYDYTTAREPVSFEADLIQDGQSLTGEIREPNSFRPDRGAELFAVLTGSVTGAEVDFIKRYLDFDQLDFPAYAGQVNAALTRIAGTWHFPRLAGLSGQFVMMRKPSAAATALRKAGAAMDLTEPVR